MNTNAPASAAAASSAPSTTPFRPLAGSVFVEGFADAGGASAFATTTGRSSVLAASVVSASSESGSSFDGMVTGAGGTTFGIATAGAFGGSLPTLEMRSSSPLAYDGELREVSRATSAGGRTVGGGVGTGLDSEVAAGADVGGSASERTATGGGVGAGRGPAASG